MRSAFIALLYIAAFHNANARPATRASPIVNVSLRTSWGAPPFLVELLYVLLTKCQLSDELLTMS